MADDRMAVLDMVRKAISDGDVDFLREGVRVLAQAVMEAEVTELTGLPVIGAVTAIVDDHQKRSERLQRRRLAMAGGAARLAIYGFGAAAHLIAQVAVWQGREVYAFTKPGDVEGQAFARSLGCAWAGDSDAAPPAPFDAALLFAPVGALVPAALRHTRKGGTVVCAGIHMSTIPAFAYDLLWGERTVRSVANLTRRDGEEFLALAARVPVRTTVELFPLAEANAALDAVRTGRVRGAAVLDCSPSA